MHIEKMTRRNTERRSFEELATHRVRRGKLHKTRRGGREEWS